MTQVRTNTGPIGAWVRALGRQLVADADAAPGRYLVGFDLLRERQLASAFTWFVRVVAIGRSPAPCCVAFGCIEGDLTLLARKVRHST